MPTHRHHRAAVPADLAPDPMPVRSDADARELLTLVASDPLAPETLAFLLTSGGEGGVLYAFDGTHELDALFDVVTVMTGIATRVPPFSLLVMASVRPHCGVLPGDADRWMEASDLADARGVRLVEWYVIGPGGMHCPRALLGEPARWSEIR